MRENSVFTLELPGTVVTKRIIERSTGFAKNLGVYGRRLIKNGSSLEGALYANAHPSLLRSLSRFFAMIIWWGHIWYLSLVVLLCLVFSIVNPAITSYMIFRAETDHVKIKPIVFLKRAQIGLGAQSMVMRLEDNNFYSHRGFSLGAMREAFERNELYGALIYGGSTITQQLSRNLFLGPNRNIVRKYLELLAVLPMEAILGKHRILELYLNTVELGPGVFGLGQGALYQFKKPYSETYTEERARLAAIIASPLRYNVNNFWSRNLLRARYNAITGFIP